MSERTDKHFTAPPLKFVLIRHRPHNHRAREYFVPDGPNSGHWVSVECPDCYIDPGQFDHYYWHAVTPGGLLYLQDGQWIIRGDYRWEGETL